MVGLNFSFNPIINLDYTLMRLDRIYQNQLIFIDLQEKYTTIFSIQKCEFNFLSFDNEIF